MGDDSVSHKEIYTYESNSPIYAMNWCYNVDKPNRLAIGSFSEGYSNKISVVQLNENTGRFELQSETEHPYPATKLMWYPDRSPGGNTDTFATTADYLRIWQINEKKQAQITTYNTNKNDFCAPLTSFDWCEDGEHIGTSSIDTTCTIWNVNNRTDPVTQFIAHDSEVYDIAFKDSNILASVGADGSVRKFDLRDLSTSTIVYETNKKELARVCWNKKDPNYLATFTLDEPRVLIIDVRISQCTAELKGHSACVNGIAWAPHSNAHICTAGDDKQTLIWAVGPNTEPILAYTAEAEINSLQWSITQPDWIAIAFGKKMQILHI